MWENSYGTTEVRAFADYSLDGEIRLDIEEREINEFKVAYV